MLPACAVAVGVALVTVTSAFTEVPKTNGPLAEYYFEYNQPTGQEADEAQWEPITQLEYEASTCSGLIHGCVLKTTSVTGSGTSMRPSKVNVTENNGEIAPITGDGVLEVKNRDVSE